VGGCELDSSCSDWGPVAGSFEHRNEPLGSIKGGYFLDWLSDFSFSRTLLHGVSYLLSQSVNQSVSQSVSQLVS